MLSVFLNSNPLLPLTFQCPLMATLCEFMPQTVHFLSFMNLLSPVLYPTEILCALPLKMTPLPLQFHPGPRVHRFSFTGSLSQNPLLPPAVCCLSQPARGHVAPVHGSQISLTFSDKTHEALCYPRLTSICRWLLAGSPVFAALCAKGSSSFLLGFLPRFFQNFASTSLIHWDLSCSSSFKSPTHPRSSSPSLAGLLPQHLLLVSVPKAVFTCRWFMLHTLH